MKLRAWNDFPEPRHEDFLELHQKHFDNKLAHVCTKIKIIVQAFDLIKEKKKFDNNTLKFIYQNITGREWPPHLEVNAENFNLRLEIVLNYYEIIKGMMYHIEDTGGVQVDI